MEDLTVSCVRCTIHPHDRVAASIDQNEHLIEWHSTHCSKYDARHLLDRPPPTPPASPGPPADELDIDGLDIERFGDDLELFEQLERRINTTNQLPEHKAVEVLLKTAGFVRENGPSMETRVQMAQAGNPLFDFLRGGDPLLGPVYRWLVAEEQHVGAQMTLLLVAERRLAIAEEEQTAAAAEREPAAATGELEAAAPEAAAAGELELVAMEEHGQEHRQEHGQEHGQEQLELMHRTAAMIAWYAACSRH